MASRTAIEGIIDEALVYCRRHTPQERESAVDLWADWFASIPYAKLKAAVAQWMLDLDPHEPNPTLPRPGVIRAILRAEATTNPPESWAPVPAGRAKPSPEFAAAQRRFHQTINGILNHGAGRLLDDALADLDRIPHHHTEEVWTDDGTELIYDGTEDCPACVRAAELGAQTRRSTSEAITEALGMLPDATPSLSRCRCLAGWLGADPVEDRGVVYAMVRPCPKCLPDLAAKVAADEARPEQPQLKGV